MSNHWNQWQNHLVDGKFPLMRYLGGSGTSAVFATQIQDRNRLIGAAIKLVPATAESGERLLIRWQESSELTHPNLIALFDSGWAKLGDAQYVYLVMERAEENLAQVLPTRALDPAEALQTADAVLNVLAYLHSKGFVHGSIKPANILASDDLLKVSNDSLYRVGEAPAGRESSSEYAAPEIIGSRTSKVEPISPASDVWSLGATLVETLIRELPRVASGDTTDPAILRTVPEPFLEIAQHCLVCDPKRRWSVAHISDRLHNRVPAQPAPAAAPKAAVRETPPAPRPPQAVTAAPVRQPASAPAPVAARAVHHAGKPAQKNKFALPVMVGCAVIFAAVLVTPRLFRRPATAPDAPEAAQAPTAETPAATAMPQQQSAPLKSTASSTKEEPQREAMPATAPSAVPALAHPEVVNEEATNTVARSSVDASTRGQVTHRAMPEVLQSAVRSIQGTVRVNVKVNVDRTGNVEDAELAARGPSKYFAHAAVEAARQWRFDPPKVGGRGVLSTWILQFEFTRDGTNVVPRQELP